MAPSSDEIVTSLEEPDEYPEPENETQRPSILSTLPVALVVEQTARILEDIKKKIQEEKRQKLEQQIRSESPSPSYSELSRPSFVILNHRHSTSSAILNNISPLNQTSFPRSLSPDSGTDYEPFSASSSISPPFLSKLKRTNAGSTSDVMKLSHNSDDDIFKPVSSFSPLIQTTNLAKISPTTSLNSIHTPARRLSGVTISHLTTTSLAKSTPSISTNLNNESHQKPEQTFSSVTQSPYSFQVLQTNFEFDTKYFDTYHDTAKAHDPLAASNDRYRSLANLPNNNLITQLTSSSCVASTPFISLLQNHNRFGNPSAIKPFASSLESPNNKFKLAGITMSPTATLSFKDNFSKSFDTARTYSSMRQNILEEQAQVKPDFLSLSLSPPMNRKRGGFVEIKGSL